LFFGEITFEKSINFFNEATSWQEGEEEEEEGSVL
jgi:hypothetical protein